MIALRAYKVARPGQLHSVVRTVSTARAHRISTWCSRFGERYELSPHGMAAQMGHTAGCMALAPWLVLRCSRKAPRGRFLASQRARKCGAIRSRGRRIDRRRHPFGRLCRRRLGRLASVSVRSQLQQSNLSAACTLRQQLFSLLVVFGASEGRAAARSSAHWAFGILSASSANVLLDAAKAEDVLAGQLVRVALRVHAD